MGEYGVVVLKTILEDFHKATEEHRRRRTECMQAAKTTGSYAELWEWDSKEYGRLHAIFMYRVRMHFQQEQVRRLEEWPNRVLCWCGGILTGGLLLIVIVFEFTQGA